MTVSVLDTSAVLAWLHDEPGNDVVEPLLPQAIMSTVNWSETAQKIAQHGADPDRTLGRLQALGVHVEPFTTVDALAAAALWPTTRVGALSLGDRACLALARRLNLPAVTADRAWRKLDVELRIQLIR